MIVNVISLIFLALFAYQKLVEQIQIIENKMEKVTNVLHNKFEN